MLRTNFNLFKRILLKNPGYLFINMVGLVLSFTVTVLIYLHLNHELSYDSFHDRSEDIYRISWFGSNPQTRTPHPMAAAMKADMPEVEAAVSLSPLYGPGLTKTTFRFKNPENDNIFDEPEGYLVDTTFFKVFSFEFVNGDPTALEKVGGLLISESMAERFFGSEDPMGKFLAFGNNEDLMEVVAIMKDPPTNSHFRFNFLISYVTAKAQNPSGNWFQWGDFGHFNYVKLSSGADYKLTESKMPTWIQKYIQATAEQIRQLEASQSRFVFQPIEGIHLTSHLRWELDENSDYSYVYLYGLSALFILLISIINFVNLSTAKSIERLKEVGVKKTLGAYKGQLFRQFLSESLVLVLMALVFSIGLVYSAIPQFNLMVQGQLSPDMIFLPEVMIGMILLAIIIALIAAFYPSVYLNAIDPGKILKGMSPNSLKGAGARNILLGVQFFMAVLLISGSLLINAQISFIKDTDLGFDQENSLVVRIKEDDQIVPRLETVKGELLSDPNIHQVTAVSNVPGGQFNHNPVFWNQDPVNRVTMGEFLIDYDAFSVLNLELTLGREFSKSHLADSAGTSYILNETAVRSLNLEEPLGKRIMYDDDDRMKEGTVVGVVKDFHFKSLHEPISPIIMQIYPDDYNFLLIKTSASGLSQTLSHVQEIYHKYDPINTFEYYFLDQSIDDLYQEEARTLNISTLFSGISIFLSIAGLIGVASVVIRKRIKEIGIRKVLGASIGQILWMLSTKFMTIAVVSLALSIPSSYVMIQKWLNNFTYQTAINPLIFVFSTLGILGLILITVSSISIKVSKSNPTSALRTE